MKTEVKDEEPLSPPAVQQDPLIGRSYLCCSGTRRGQTVTVTGRAVGGEERYQLESERGPTWTINREKLARIFGPSGKEVASAAP